MEKRVKGLVLFILLFLLSVYVVYAAFSGTIIKPLQGGWVNGTYTIEVQIAEGNATQNVTCWYNTTSAAWIFAGVNASENLSWYNITWATDASIDDGVYYLNCTGYDNSTGENNSVIRRIKYDNKAPTKPDLTAPANNTMSTNKTPLLGWQQVTEVFFINYTIYISQAADFATVNFTYNVTNQAAPQWQINESDNLSEGLWYWKVTAFDMLGRSNNSNVSYYTVDTISPTTPSYVLSTLADGANTTGNDIVVNVTFTETNLGAALVSFWNDTLPVNYTMSCNATTGAIQCNATVWDVPDGHWNYTVQVNDSVNHISTSAIRFVHVDTVAPTKPDTTAPVNGTYSTNMTPLLTWRNPTEANFNNYTIQISQDASFATLNFTYSQTTKTTVTQQITEANNLSQDGAWYWRVIVYDAAGTSNVSNITYYYIDTISPTTPSYVLSTLADGANTTGNDIVVNVTFTETNLGAALVSFWNDTLPVNYTMSCNATTGAIQCNATVWDVPDGHWNYTVQVNDSVNHISTSAIRFVHVDTVAPTKPDTTAPVNGTYYGNRTPLLTWREVTEANFNNYTIQVSQAADFATVNFTYTITARTTTTKQITEANNLSQDGWWYWRVTAYDHAGTSNTSNVTYYLLDTVAPYIFNVTPINNGWITNDTSVLFNVNLNETHWNSTSNITLNIQRCTAGDGGCAGMTSSLLTCYNNSDTQAMYYCNGTINLNALFGVALQENWYVRYYLNSTDAAGNLGQNGTFAGYLNASADYTVPTTPVFVSPTPGNNTYYTSATVSINITTTELHIGYANISFWNATGGQFNKTMTCADAAGSVMCNVSIPSQKDSSFNFTVNVTDLAGHSAQNDRRLIVIDTTVPTTPTALTPTTGGFSTNKTPLLNWTAPTEVNFKNYTIQVSDQASFSVINYTYSITDNVANTGYQVTEAGQWTDNMIWFWRVNIYDQAGFSNVSATANYTIDNTAPTEPAFVSPTQADGYNSSTTTITVNVTFTETNPDTCVLIAYNETGNGKVPSNTTMNLRGSYCEIVNVDLVNNGHLNYTVAVNDSDNHINTSVIRFVTIDTVAPTAPTPASPINNTVSSVTTPLLNWTTVTEVNLRNYTLQISNTTDFATLNALYTVITNDPEYKGYTIGALTASQTIYWRVIAYDAVDRSTVSGMFNYTVDTTAPALSYGYPSNMSFIQGNASQPFRVNLTEKNINSTANVTLYYRWGGAAEAQAYTAKTMVCSGNANAGYLCVATVDMTSGWATGENVTYYFNSTDLAGNSGLLGSSTDYFIATKDNIKPTITAVFYSDGDNVSMASQSIYINLTANDVNSRISTVYASGDGGATNVVMTNTSATAFNVTATPLALGCTDNSACTLRFNATDLAGNFNDTVTYAITVDSTAPKAPYLTAPANNTYSSDTTPLLNWTNVTEANFKNYTIQISQDITFASVNFTVTNTSQLYVDLEYQILEANNWSQDGPWYWRVIVYDLADNSNVSNTSIYNLDTTPPTIPGFVSPTPGNNSYHASANVAINVTFTETNLLYANLTFYNATGTGVYNYTMSCNASTGAIMCNVTVYSQVDGLANFTVNVTDKASNSRITDLRIFTIDTTAPTKPDTTAPLNGSYRTNITPLLDWATVTEANFKNYTVEVSSSPSFTSNLLSTNVDVRTTSNYQMLEANPLTEGAWYWRVTAYDQAGISNVSNVTYYTVDTTLPTTPVFVSPTPGNNSYYTSADIVINVTFTETNLLYANLTFYNATGTGVYNYTMSCNATTGAIMCNATVWSQVDGLANFTVNVTDQALNSRMTDLRIFTIDTTAPTKPDTTAPLNGSYSTNITPLLDWATVTEANFKNYTVEVSSSPIFGGLLLTTNVDVRTTSNYQMLEANPLTEGAWYWRVTAYDQAGVSNVSNVTYYTVDLTSPTTPAFVSPTQADYTNVSATSISINVTLTEANLDLVYVELWNNSLSYNHTMSCNGTTGPVMCNVTIPDVPNGHINYTVIANDTVNHTTVSARKYMTLDNVAPVAAPVHFNGQAFGNGSHAVQVGQVVPLNVTVFDGTSLTTGACTVYLNGTLAGTLAYVNTSWCAGTITVPGTLTAGFYVLNISVTDSAGNIGRNESAETNIVNVTGDSTKPEVIITAINPVNAKLGTVIYINASVIESGSGLGGNNCTVYLLNSTRDGSFAIGNITQTGGTCNGSVTLGGMPAGMTQGSVTVNLTISDLSTNVGSNTTYNITADTIMPSITVRNMVYNGNYSVSQIYINGTCEDTGYGPNMTWINDSRFTEVLDNATNFAYLNNTVIADGVVNVMISCNDTTVQNQNDTIFQFTVDRTSPTISFTMPAADTIFGPGHIIEINATINDTTLFVANAYYVVNGSGNSTPMTNASSLSTAKWNGSMLEAGGLGEGAHSITIYANDSATPGNTFMAMRNITVDLSGPSSAVGLTTGSQLPSGTMVVQVRVNDTVRTNGTMTLHYKLGSASWASTALTGTAGTSTVYNATIYTLALADGEIVLYYVNGTDSVDNRIAGAVGGSQESPLANFTIDKGAPRITYSSPGGVITSATTVLNITTSEASTCKFMENRSFDFSTEGTAFTAVNSGKTIHQQSLSGLAEGDHFYYVVCNDSSNNIMNAWPIWFSVYTDGSYNYTQWIDPAWDTLWIPTQAIMTNMSYTSYYINTTLDQSIAGKYTAVYYYNSTHWTVYSPTVGWAGSDLKYINNTNDKPYWVHLNVTSKVRFWI